MSADPEHVAEDAFTTDATDTQHSPLHEATTPTMYTNLEVALSTRRLHLLDRYLASDAWLPESLPPDPHRRMNLGTTMVHFLHDEGTYIFDHTEPTDPPVALPLPPGYINSSVSRYFGRIVGDARYPEPERELYWKFSHRYSRKFPEVSLGINLLRTIHDAVKASWQDDMKERERAAMDAILIQGMSLSTIIAARSRALRHIE